jgi:PIN domain nuclease of toxin-antitoxin system
LGEPEAVIYALDGSAMIAFLRKEPGWDVVADLLSNVDNTCYAHAVNLCEVFYDYHRVGGEAAAQTALATLAAIRVLPRADMDPDFWQQVGRHKATYRHISIADCFCIALAQRLGGEAVTSDHHEFDPLVPLGLCPIRFIR